MDEPARTVKADVDALLQVFMNDGILFLHNKELTHQYNVQQLRHIED